MSSLKNKTPKTNNVSKRNNQKFECPVYIYKPIESKDPYAENSKNDSGQTFTELYITSFYISSVDSDRQWVERNVCMVCEVPDCL